MKRGKRYLAALMIVAMVFANVGPGVWAALAGTEKDVLFEIEAFDLIAEIEEAAVGRLEMGDVEIKCPVWLVTGEKDKTGKVKKYNRLWHEKEGYPLHIISRAAHNANYDNAEEVNRLLEQFVKKLG